MTSVVQEARLSILNSHTRDALYLLADYVRGKDSKLSDQIKEIQLEWNDREKMSRWLSVEEKLRKESLVNSMLLKILPAVEKLEESIPITEEAVSKRFKNGASTTTASSAPVNIFISYSYRDEVHKEHLLIGLDQYIKEDIVRIWEDRQLSAGQNWAEEVFKSMRHSDIILLLVSPDFLASDFVYNNELHTAMEMHRRGLTKVIPILLKPCDYSTFPFADLQFLPKNAKPVTSWSNQDDAWKEVIQSIRSKVAQIKAQPQT